jgi:hypothetical protein
MTGTKEKNSKPIPSNPFNFVSIYADNPLMGSDKSLVLSMRDKIIKYVFLLFLFAFGVVSGLLELLVFKNWLVQVGYLVGVFILIVQMNKKLNKKL